MECIYRLLCFASASEHNRFPHPTKRPLILLQEMTGTIVLRKEKESCMESFSSIQEHWDFRWMVMYFPFSFRPATNQALNFPHDCETCNQPDSTTKVLQSTLGYIMQIYVCIVYHRSTVNGSPKDSLHAVLILLSLASRWVPSPEKEKSAMGTKRLTNEKSSHKK